MYFLFPLIFILALVLSFYLFFGKPCLFLKDMNLIQARDKVRIGVNRIGQIAYSVA